MDENSERAHPKQQTDAIAAMLSEFLEGFAIVGYTPTGKRFVLVHTPNEMVADAVARLQRCVANALNENPIELLDSNAPESEPADE